MTNRKFKVYDKSTLIAICRYAKDAAYLWRKGPNRIVEATYRIGSFPVKQRVLELLVWESKDEPDYDALAELIHKRIRRYCIDNELNN